MGFWIFMIFVNLLTPIIMIILGNYFNKKAPKEINIVFGYRTKMSMKSKDTWKFAHQYCGKLWLRIGLIMLILSIISMLFVIDKDTKVIGIFSGFISGLQILILIISIFPTEIALRKHFDENGNRKN